MLSTLTTLLTDPAQFFADRDDLGLMGPLAVVGGIVALGVLAALVGSLLTSQLISTRMAQTPRQSLLVGGFSFVFAAVGRIVGPVLWWLLFAGLFYLLTELFDGAGDFDQVLAVTAWGLVPRLLTIGLSLLLALVGLGLLTTGMGPGIVRVLSGVGSLVGAATTLWSGYIWGHGLADVRGVTVREGYLAVAPVVVLGVLVTLGSAAVAVFSGLGSL